MLSPLSVPVLGILPTHLLTGMYVLICLPCVSLQIKLGVEEGAWVTGLSSALGSIPHIVGASYLLYEGSMSSLTKLEKGCSAQFTVRKTQKLSEAMNLKKQNIWGAEL